jgi:hypothetical protein
VKDEQEEDLLNVLIPTTRYDSPLIVKRVTQFYRVRLAQQEGIELNPMASQSQPEAGSSHPTRRARHREAQSSSGQSCEAKANVA